MVAASYLGQAIYYAAHYVLSRLQDRTYPKRLSAVVRLRLRTNSTRKLSSYCDRGASRRRSGAFTGPARAFVILPSTWAFPPTTRAIRDSVVARAFRSSIDHSAYTPSSISGRAPYNSALWGVVGRVPTFPSHWSWIFSPTHLARLQLRSTSISKRMLNRKMFYRLRVRWLDMNGDCVPATKHCRTALYLAELHVTH